MGVDRIRSLLVAAAAVFGVLMIPAGTASAHAELVSSNPANQAVLSSSPGEILLTFTENVDPIDPSIRVVDADGDDVAIGDVSQASGASTLSASVPDSLADGTYVVGWQAVSADSHKVRGAFTFSIGTPSPTAPGVVDGIFADSSSQSESFVLGGGRFVSFGAVGVLLGAFFLALTITPELIATGRIGRVLGVAAAAAIAGTLLMIAGQAHLLTGSYLAIGDVADTQSGRWWLARLVAIALFSALVPFRSLLAPLAGRLIVVVAGLGVLTVVAAGGHAIAGDQVVLGFGATVVHLAAMSIWTGGLVLLALGVPRAWFWWTASQFSPWALGSVVALAVTGSTNAWRQLGSFDGLTDSAFGRWLVIKLMLVVIVVVIASFSRRLARSDDATSDPQEVPVALRRTVVFEIAGIALILMATAGLVNSPPPPSSVAVTQSASAVVGERVVQVELEPAVTGGTEMHVYLTSPGGGLDQADEISVAAYLPEAELGPIIVGTVPAGPNHVIATDLDLPLAGLWSFDVAARFGEFDQIVFTVQIPVTD